MIKVTSSAENKALAAIEDLEDTSRLRAFMVNAKSRSDVVYDAAFQRLVTVQAKGPVGSAERDLWKVIHAIEELKREDSGKTVRLSYLRRDIEKLGIIPAINKLVSKPGPSERFQELIERGYPQLTAEAVVLKHPADFSPQSVELSEKRLRDAGIDPAIFIP
jgi:hypothetical protein